MIRYPSEALEFDTLDDWYQDKIQVKGRIYYGHLVNGAIEFKKIHKITDVDSKEPSDILRGILRLTGQILNELEVERGAESRRTYLRYYPPGSSGVEVYALNSRGLLTLTAKSDSIRYVGL